MNDADQKSMISASSAEDNSISFVGYERRDGSIPMDSNVPTCAGQTLMSTVDAHLNETFLHDLNDSAYDYYGLVNQVLNGEQSFTDLESNDPNIWLLEDFPEMLLPKSDPNNNNEEATRESLNNNSAPSSPTASDLSDSLSSSEDEGLPYAHSIVIRSNKDIKPNSLHFEAAWTKNKLRSLLLYIDGLEGPVFISDTNFVKGNGKTNPPPQTATDFLMQLDLCDPETGLPLEHCAKCRSKKMVEVTSSSGQRMTCSNGILDIQARIQCLPSAHGKKAFLLRISIYAPDGHQFAVTYLPVPQVIASRATQKKPKTK